MHSIPDYPTEETAWVPSNVKDTLTQLLVDRKLHYLEDEVGKTGEEGMWPQPCGDALSFVKTIHELHDTGYPVDLGVVSSGHTTFITKTFEAWGLDQPQVLVTDEDLRYRNSPLEINRRVKPGQFPLALAHKKWLDLQGVDAAHFLSFAAESKKRMTYVEDDSTKDVGMANIGRIQAIHYPTTTWQQLTENLWTNRNLLDGRSITEIFQQSHQKKEVFISLPQTEQLRSLTRGQRA